MEQDFITPLDFYQIAASSGSEAGKALLKWLEYSIEQSRSALETCDPADSGRVAFHQARVYAYKDIRQLMLADPQVLAGEMGE